MTDAEKIRLAIEEEVYVGRVDILLAAEVVRLAGELRTVRDKMEMLRKRSEWLSDNGAGGVFVEEVLAFLTGSLKATERPPPMQRLFDHPPVRASGQETRINDDIGGE